MKFDESKAPNNGLKLFRASNQLSSNRSFHPKMPFRIMKTRVPVAVGPNRPSGRKPQPSSADLNLAYEPPISYNSQQKKKVELRQQKMQHRNGLESIASVQKSYHCTFPDCSMTFYRNRDLDIHHQSHLKTKLYVGSLYSMISSRVHVIDSVIQVCDEPGCESAFAQIDQLAVSELYPLLARF